MPQESRLRCTIRIPVLDLNDARAIFMQATVEGLFRNTVLPTHLANGAGLALRLLQNADDLLLTEPRALHQNPPFHFFEDSNISCGPVFGGAGHSIQIDTIRNDTT